MDEGKGRSDAPQQQQGIAQRQRPPPEAMAQILSIEPLHGEKALSARGLAMRDVGDDAGMAQLGEELGLTRKAPRFLVVGHRRLEIEQLKRHQAAGESIAGAVDRPHTAGACWALELEAIGESVAGARQ